MGAAWGVSEVVGMSVADLVEIGTSTSTSGAGAAMEWSGMSGVGSKVDLEVVFYSGNDEGVADEGDV